MPLTIPLFSTECANQGIDLTTPLQRVLKSNRYILGDEVKSFETEFAAYIGTRFCVTVANGTDALTLALRALNVGPGDTVATVANAGFYASTAIHLVGARPQYVDIDPFTMTMGVDEARTTLLTKPKALILTHLYGQMAHVEEICRLAERMDVPVIEDCAQAHGAERGGRKAGSFGKLSCFSFYPTKNLGAVGDGGAICTWDEDLMVRLKKLRQYGWQQKYEVCLQGGSNSRMDELQAAVLRTKLPHLNDANRWRQRIAIAYNTAFAGLPLLCPRLGSDFVAHLYVLRLAARDTFRAFTSEHGVATEIHYPIPDHLQPVCTRLSFALQLPATENVCDTVVTLPCFPGMTDAQVSVVIETTHAFFKDHHR